VSRDIAKSISFESINACCRQLFGCPCFSETDGVGTDGIVILVQYLPRLLDPVIANCAPRENIRRLRIGCGDKQKTESQDMTQAGPMHSKLCHLGKDESRSRDMQRPEFAPISLPDCPSGCARSQSR